MRHLDRADRFPVDQVTEQARAADYDAVVLPGGVANPDQLRTDAPAVDFLMAMFEAGKPVAAICHGPWTLIEGDLVAGRTLTSWPSLQTDLRNAGAYWVDRDVVVCRLGINTLVTSRQPDDLDAFCREITAVRSGGGPPSEAFRRLAAWRPSEPGGGDDRPVEVRPVMPPSLGASP